jgi:hypothetical protein
MSEMESNNHRKSISWYEQPHICLYLPAEEDDEVSVLTSPNFESADSATYNFWTEQGNKVDRYLSCHFDKSFDYLCQALAPTSDEENTYENGFFSSLFRDGSCGSITLDWMKLDERTAPTIEDSGISDEKSVSSGPVRLGGILRPSTYATPNDNRGHSGFILVTTEDEGRMKTLMRHVRRPSIGNGLSAQTAPRKKSEAKAVYRIEVVLAPDRLGRSKNSSTMSKILKKNLSALNCMSNRSSLMTADDVRDEHLEDARQ